VAVGAGDQTADQDPVHALRLSKDGRRLSQRTDRIPTIFFLLIALAVITAVVQRF